MNRNSIKSFHDLPSVMPKQFATGLAAELNRERIKTEQAVIAKERQRNYWARMRRDTTPGDRVVQHAN